MTVQCELMRGRRPSVVLPRAVRGWSPPSGLLSLWPLSFYLSSLFLLHYLFPLNVFLPRRSEGSLHHQASSLSLFIFIVLSFYISSFFLYSSFFKCGSAPGSQRVVSTIRPPLAFILDLLIFLYF